MPFVRGESLRDRLNREKQLALDDALDINRQITSALDYAHRQGIVHRDISRRTFCFMKARQFSPTSGSRWRSRKRRDIA
jgi:serine/threonine protein kinase